MTYVLPKPRYTTAKLYTASQVQDAYTAGRAAGLEAAAAMCDDEDVAPTDDALGTVNYLAMQIRKLASNAEVSGLSTRPPC